MEAAQGHDCPNFPVPAQLPPLSALNSGRASSRAVPSPTVGPTGPIVPTTPSAPTTPKGNNGNKGNDGTTGLTPQSGGAQSP
jgi:hypothetical protein